MTFRTVLVTLLTAAMAGCASHENISLGEDHADGAAAVTPSGPANVADGSAPILTGDGGASVRGADGGATNLTVQSCTDPKTMLMFSKSCRADTDCALAFGGCRVTGISASELDRYKAWQMSCPVDVSGRNCQIQVDDGSALTSGTDTPAAACAGGLCMSYRKGCGSPCSPGLQCHSCLWKVSFYYACTTICRSDTDCKDPGLPKCHKDSAGLPEGFCASATSVCELRP